MTRATVLPFSSRLASPFGTRNAAPVWGIPAALPAEPAKPALGLDDVGVVVIGRNEGDRLALCLSALLASGVAHDHVVYVDSGSSDGSMARALARGVDVVALVAPFTAAKGRNAGFQHLVARHPALLAVQFADGDCEYQPAWLTAASRTLRADPTIAAVTGALHERRPEASVYNLLAELEWNGAAGEIETFAGNVMLRVSSLQKAGLFDPTLIAGEDPELAIRVRKATGQRIVRLDEPMALHDVNMTRVSQWWRRCVRAGHAYAEVSRMHGEAPRFFWRRETRSNWVWGALPVVALPLAAPAWGLLALRIYRAARRRGLDARTARLYALSTTAAKLPQAFGQLTYWWNALRGVTPTIIEYKGAAAPAVDVYVDRSAAVDAPVVIALNGAAAQRNGDQAAAAVLAQG